MLSLRIMYASLYATIKGCQPDCYILLQVTPYKENVIAYS